MEANENEMSSEQWQLNALTNAIRLTLSGNYIDPLADRNSTVPSSASGSTLSKLLLGGIHCWRPVKLLFTCCRWKRSFVQRLLSEKRLGTMMNRLSRTKHPGKLVGKTLNQELFVVLEDFCVLTNTAMALTLTASRLCPVLEIKMRSLHSLLALLVNDHPRIQECCACTLANVLCLNRETVLQTLAKAQGQLHVAKVMARNYTNVFVQRECARCLINMFVAPPRWRGLQLLKADQYDKGSMTAVETVEYRKNLTARGFSNAEWKESLRRLSHSGRWFILLLYSSGKYGLYAAPGAHEKSFSLLPSTISCRRREGSS